MMEGACVGMTTLPAVGSTWLGGLVAVSAPKFHSDQSTALLVGAGVGVMVTVGVGVMTVSKVWALSPTVRPLSPSTTRSGSI